MSRFDMDRLTAEDVDMLLDALTELEKTKVKELPPSVVMDIMAADSKESFNTALAGLKHAVEQQSPKQRLLQERVALLKAKIILLRDRQFAEDVLSADVPSREK